MPHRDVHEKHQKQSRPNESLRQPWRLAILQRFLFDRHQRTSRRPWIFHGRSSIACLLHRTHDRILSGRTLDNHGIRQKRDGNFGNAGHFFHRPLHMPLARRTCHASDDEMVFVIYRMQNSPPRKWVQGSPQGLPLNLEVRKQGLGVSSAW